MTSGAGLSIARWAQPFTLNGNFERERLSQFEAAAVSAGNAAAVVVQSLLRDGPYHRPPAKLNQLLEQDGWHLSRCGLLLAVKGLVTRGVDLILELAATMKTPVIVLTWPGASDELLALPKSPSLVLLGSIMLTDPAEVRSELVELMVRNRDLIGTAQRFATTKRPHERLDARPGSLRRLMRSYEPVPLDESQLADRADMSTQRIRLAMHFSWDLVNLDRGEVERMAAGLHVTPEELDAISSKKAQIHRWEHQVGEWAFIHGSPTPELFFALGSLVHRSQPESIVDLTPSQLVIIFNTARRAAGGRQ